MNSELTPKELAEAYLRQLHGQVYPSAEESFNALYIWEDLICKEPERAWPVFLELLAGRNDDDTLEQISYRLELLLSRHWNDFQERVKRLVHGHEDLPRFLPDEKLAMERFKRKEVTDDEIVEAYLEHYRHTNNIYRIERLIEAYPEEALPLVLEIVNRGQLYGFGSFDLISPLRDLLRHQGEGIIDRIEQEAASSVMLRRCLWRLKRQQRNTPSEYAIADEVWRRAERAAGETNDYNSDLPGEARPNPLSEEGEELLSSWFASEQTSWAFDTVWGLTRHNPDRLWAITKALVMAAPDDATLSYIGAGPLEDLLSSYGEQFIGLIEQQAAVDAKFKFCLAGVWRSGMSEEIWQRVTTALGS
jgi:hypothetical protein